MHENAWNAVLKLKHGGAKGAQHLRSGSVERTQPLESRSVSKRELVRKVGALNTFLRGLDFAQS